MHVNYILLNENMNQGGAFSEKYCLKNKMFFINELLKKILRIIFCNTNV